MPYLTNDIVMKLAPQERPYKVFDEIVPGKRPGDQGVTGFLVRVLPSGAKTFAFSYRPVNGGPKGWVKIGPFGAFTVEKGREEARKHQYSVAQGEDPAKSRREDREAPTLAKMVDAFVEDYLPQKSPRTQAEYERILLKYVVPKLGQKKSREIGTEDMYTLLKEIKKRAPIQANRVLAVARKMFNWGEVSGYRDRHTNPCIGQDWTTEVPRDRRLHRPEIEALGQIIREVMAMRPDEAPKKVDGAKLEPESVYALAAVQLFLLGAFRKNELLKLQWSWVHLDQGRVVIPAKSVEADEETGESKTVFNHKTARKTGKDRVIYLCPAAVEILKALPRQDADEDDERYNPYVIPGHRIGGHLVQVWDVWERLRAAATDRSKHLAKEKGKKREAVNLMDVTIHDLRRTFASVAADLGHPELVIKALLGHTGLGSVTEVYTRLSADPIRAAVDQVGGVIAGWMGVQSSSEK